MGKIETKKYSLFTGCVIPSKYPFIEKASRKVLENLGLKLEEIEGAGGKIVREKSEIPNVGWMALFSDVFGNVLGLFKPMQK